MFKLPSSSKWLSSAFKHFLESMGWKPKKILLPILWFAFGTISHGVRFGWQEAMKEWQMWINFTAVPIVIFFVLGFLWHLWLEPYRDMGHRLQMAIDSLEGSRGLDMNPPAKANIDDWENVELFSLKDAACLWVDLEPHWPLRDQKAKAVFAQLRGAIKMDRLHCEKPPFQDLPALFGGTDVPWASENKPVFRVELARYAHSTGNPVPDFLKVVELPAEDEHS